MSGVTEIAFRTLIRSLNRGSLGLTVSEFVSVEGLTRKNKKTVQMMKSTVDEAPFSIQIFGSRPQAMAEGALLAQEAGADIIDINAGCPAPKIVKKGGGSDLLRNLKLLEKIIRAVKESVTVPVTLKIRSGWDSDSMVACSVAEIAEQNGIDMLCVHPRTRVQGYRGTADWEVIRAVRERIKIPLVGNGDIREPHTALERLRDYGVQGLMIGRGALGDPWIFRRITETWNQGKSFEPSARDRAGVFGSYRENLIQFGFPERGILGRLKQMAGRMIKGARGSAALRQGLLRSGSCEEFFDLLESSLS
jgi:nifR3 family TIM-barrel protein